MFTVVALVSGKVLENYITAKSESREQRNKAYARLLDILIDGFFIKLNTYSNKNDFILEYLDTINCISKDLIINSSDYILKEWISYINKHKNVLLSLPALQDMEEYFKNSMLPDTDKIIKQTRQEMDSRNSSLKKYKISDLYIHK